MGDGIGFADVGEEFVSQALALGRARDQTGNVDEFDRSRNEFLRFGDGHQWRQPHVRHLDDADVGLDGAKGIILRGDTGLGERVE